MFMSDEDGLVVEYAGYRDARLTRVRKLQADGAIRTDIGAEEIVRHFEVCRNATFRRWLLSEDDSLSGLIRAMNTAMALVMGGVAPDRTN